MISLFKAEEYAKFLIRYFQDKGIRVEITGAVRRRLPEINVIVVVVESPMKEVDTLIKDLCKLLSWEILPLSKGEPLKKRDYLINGGINFRFYKASKEYWGAMLLYTTGNFLFNKMLRAVAREKGYKLNQYGLWHLGEIVGGKSELQVFNGLGLDFVEAVDREADNKFNLKRRYYLA